MHARFKPFVAALLAAVLAAPAFAAQETFDITWSGASFGNQASATGLLTIDTSVLSQGSFALPDPAVAGFEITISGASAGNGTFGLADFSSLDFSAPAGLDLSRELIGQPLGGGVTFGDASGNGGDFNVFGNGPAAPGGEFYFTLGADGGFGDEMLVTSIAPVGVPAVSEAPRGTLLLAGLGIVALAARRRRRRG